MKKYIRLTIHSDNDYTQYLQQAVVAYFNAHEYRYNDIYIALCRGDVQKDIMELTKIISNARDVGWEIIHQFDYQIKDGTHKYIEEGFKVEFSDEMLENWDNYENIIITGCGHHKEEYNIFIA